MKIQTIIALALIFAFASSSQAEHPRDFVSGDAFAVLSIRDGDAINAIGKTVRQQAGFANSESILSNYLSVFIENPAAIDFSEEVLFVIEPTVVAEGQQPTGMFGLMPHLVFICKPKDGQAVKIKNEYLKSSVLSAGWFIATGGTSVPEPKTYRKSPILATLKSKQVSMAVRF